MNTKMTQEQIMSQLSANPYMTLNKHTQEENCLPIILVAVVAVVWIVVSTAFFGIPQF